MCGESLARFEDAAGATVLVHNPDRATGSRDRDHEVVVGLSSQLPANAVCDCCGAAPPVDIWLPGTGPVQTLPAPETGDVDLSWQTPWATCKACSRAVAARNLEILIRRWRAFTQAPLDSSDDRELKVRALLTPFITSEPTGPYKLGSPQPGG